ncbi:SH3 domain protein [Trypanosoma cruzi]|nr:SH3 domain protein [Trypanosoma cruzi]
MRAFPESLSTCGARTVVGTGRKTRLNFPSSVACVDWRGGSGAGSHRSLHEFWQDLTAGISGAAHAGVRPRHSALQHSRPSLHRCSPDRHLCEGNPASRGTAGYANLFAMPVMPCLWTRHVYMQCAPEKELVTIQASVNKRPRGCRTPLMNADDGSSIQPTTSHPILTGVAPHRRCSTLYFKLPDAIVGKGNGAYP